MQIASTLQAKDMDLIFLQENPSFSSSKLDYNQHPLLTSANIICHEYVESSFDLVAALQMQPDFVADNEDIEKLHKDSIQSKINKHTFSKEQDYQR